MAFSRNRSFNNRGSFGGSRSFDKPAMHQAVCDNCGKSCEVPFKPTNGKPVYCSNCFESRRPDSGRPEGRSFQRPSSLQYDKQFALLNSKLDKLLDILAPIAAEVEEEKAAAENQEVEQGKP